MASAILSLILSCAWRKKVSSLISLNLLYDREVGPPCSLPSLLVLRFPL